MISMKDFQEQMPENDRVVQMALREIDTGLLADACLAMSGDEREIVYRNMSVRAKDMLQEEVAGAEGRTPQHAADKALEFFLQKLRKYRNYLRDSEVREAGAAGEGAVGAGDRESGPPKLDTATDARIVESFAALSRYARVNGMLALDAVETVSPYRLAQKGLQLVVDGWDPMLSRTILEQIKRTEMKRVERQLDMLIEGFDALVADDPPLVLREKLEAFLES